MKKDNITDNISIIGSYITGFILLFISMFIVFFIVFALIANLIVTTNKTTTKTVQLYSIGQEQELQGSFILGSGIVQNKEVYAAYEILEDGGKKYFTMDKDKTVVYETLKADEMPYAEITETQLYIKSIKLYVPEGTIIQNININS